jgi:hypothetical protein
MKKQYANTNSFRNPWAGRYEGGALVRYTQSGARLSHLRPGRMAGELTRKMPRCNREVSRSTDKAIGPDISEENQRKVAAGVLKQTPQRFLC